MKKIPVAILGATGTVGQRFVELLLNHPWFEIASLAASDRSEGKRYGDIVRWASPVNLPKHIADMTIAPCRAGIPGRIAFSGLDSSVAGEIETEFAKAGYAVISNSKNHRMDKDVPLLIPEINPEHLELIKQQKFGKGCIVTNPNCSVIGVAMALKPLVDLFGVETAHIVTMQAISGAGYPGVASLDILDNVIPFINGEEDKLETEPLKILGTKIKISAQCTRVPVQDGHLAMVSVKLQKPAEASTIINSFRSFKGEPQKLDLPFAPKHPLVYLEGENHPQPKVHRMLENGMVVSVGRLRKCSILDWKFVVLSHNTVRGAAGCALLNAELMVKKGLIE